MGTTPNESKSILQCISASKFPQDYKEMPLRGACPLSPGSAFVSQTEQTNKRDETPGLHTEHWSQVDKESFESSFRHYARNKRSNLWLSSELSYILNIDMQRKPPQKSKQFLLYGEGMPAIVGVLYEGKTRSEAETYSVELARRLTQSLMNHCPGHFLLIAIALLKNDFETATIEKAVEQKRELMEGLYRRKLEHETYEYLQLDNAVTTQQRMSYAPFFLHSSPHCLDTLCVVEKAWFGLLASYIEELVQTHRLHVTFSSDHETKFKQLAALLEACRRIGSQAAVWLKGSDFDNSFVSDVKDFKDQAKKQLHQNLKIVFGSSRKRKSMKNAYVITISLQEEADREHNIQLSLRMEKVQKEKRKTSHRKISSRKAGIGNTEKTGDPNKENETMVPDRRVTRSSNKEKITLCGEEATELTLTHGKERHTPSMTGENETQTHMMKYSSQIKTRSMNGDEEIHMRTESERKTMTGTGKRTRESEEEPEMLSPMKVQKCLMKEVMEQSVNIGIATNISGEKCITHKMNRKEPETVPKEMDTSTSEYSGWTTRERTKRNNRLGKKVTCCILT